jgi:molecular chaperone DnaK (HSP70)
MILDAAAVAGLRVSKLLNSTTAAAIAYSMYHRQRLPETAVPVAILDFGDTSMNIAICQMSHGAFEVRGFAHDVYIGGRDFTDTLENYLLARTRNEYHIDPSTSSRAVIRFRQAVDRVKRALSVNPVILFEVSRSTASTSGSRFDGVNLSH